MSLRICEMYDISCDICNKNWSDEHEFAMSEGERDKMEEKAEQEGWKNDENFLNYCPECEIKCR